MERTYSDENLERLCNEEVDEITWINSVLATAATYEQKEKITNHLVQALQTKMSNLNVHLEMLSSQVRNDLPEWLQSVDKLDNEAAQLNEAMQSINKRIVEIDNNTKEFVQDIEISHREKIKLQKTLNGIYEADNWSVAVAQVDDLLETNDIDAIAEKVMKMQKSLVHLELEPEYDARKLKLDEVKDRLEALSTPLIAEAFSSFNLDTVKCNHFVQLFKSIERLPQLIQYYEKCQKNVLLQKWRHHLQVDQDEQISIWLPSYYDYLIGHFNNQLKWCSSIVAIDDALNTLINIYLQLLNDIRANFNDCIDRALLETSQKLNVLISLKDITNKFSANLLAAIKNSTKDERTTAKLWPPLVNSMFAPYARFVDKLSDLSNLNTKHVEEALKNETSLAEKIQVLNLKLTGDFDQLKTVTNRWQYFSETCGYRSLIKTSKLYLIEYTTIYDTIWRALQTTIDDWLKFKMCLTLMQTIGKFLFLLQTFEMDIVAAMAKASQNDCMHLFLDAKERDEYCRFLTINSTNVLEFKEIYEAVRGLCDGIDKSIYLIILGPIKAQFALVRTAFLDMNRIFMQKDLPSYSYTPQEYITQIGQYLMTVPQHLEPFFMQDNIYLKTALKQVHAEYGSGVADEENGLARIILDFISQKVCNNYCKHILQIVELRGSSYKQLAADIEYLGNILDDLELKLSEQLRDMLILLRMPVEEYANVSARHPAIASKLIEHIRRLRNISCKQLI